MKKIIVNENERVLVIENGKVLDLLRPGKHRFWNTWFSSYEFKIFDINIPQLNTYWADSLIKNNRELVGDNMVVVDVQDNQVGVVSLDGKLHEVIAPGSKCLYWKILKSVEVEYVDISEYYEIPEDKAGLFSKRLAGSVQITSHTVPESHEGMLYVDGKFVKLLRPGVYSFFKGQKEIGLFPVDKRLKNLEMAGQEIITKDRVSVRVNFEAYYKIVDSIKACSEVVDFEKFLYKELQMLIRESVGKHTLDELIDNKYVIAKQILERIKNAAAIVGVEFKSSGIKDIILPGDMRELINKVVCAQKEAQANVIKRREEVAATRSMLNTAKMMEENPIVFKLKQMESIEKITSKVQNLNMFGGINQLVDQLGGKLE